MNLAEMLAYADISDLNRIAATYACTCRSYSKNELIQSILASAARRDVLMRELAGLPPEELRFLLLLLFDRRNVFSPEELTAFANQSNFDADRNDGWNPRSLIASFKNKGWLFNGFNRQTKSLYQFPGDFKTRIPRLLAEQFRERLQTFAEPPAVYRDEQQLLSDDLLAFLQYAGKHEVALSAEGYMYKRTVQQLMELFAVAEPPLPKTAWRFGYGRRFKEYPDRFSFIYDYCFYNGWIAEEPGRLVLTEKGEERLAAGTPEKLQRLYQFWIRLYKNAVPNIQAIVPWFVLLAEDWVGSASLFGVLQPFIRPYYYDSSESIWQLRIVGMMMHLGLIRIGEVEGYGAVVQITDAGKAAIAGTSIAGDDKIDLEIDMRNRQGV